MGELLHLVQGTPSAETVEALVYLLQEARAGRIVGMAWVARHGGRAFTADAVGAARDDPVPTLGMLRVLDEEITQLLRR